MPELFYNTITPTLKKILGELMEAPEFATFRLVGGTALSLQRGHRESADIDLFSDAAYEDFDPVCLRGKYWEIIKLDMIDFVAA